MHPRRVAGPALATTEADVLQPRLLRGAVNDQVFEAAINIATAFEALHRVGSTPPLEHKDTGVRTCMTQVLQQEERRSEASTDNDCRVACRVDRRRQLV